MTILLFLSFFALATMRCDEIDDLLFSGNHDEIEFPRDDMSNTEKAAFMADVYGKILLSGKK